MSNQEFTETRSVILEWKLTNLKTLFEQSKGDVKSKCIKSALFDNHRWQIFLYPNSGHDQYVSLYLSCEPTAAERERGMTEGARWAEEAAAGLGPGNEQEYQERMRSYGQFNHKQVSSQHHQHGQHNQSGAGGGGKPDGGNRSGPWRREGKFKFTFEAKSIDRRMTFKSMDASDHAFSDTARNWGYSAFWKRSEAYYNNPTVRNADAVLFVCTIVYSPTPPTPPPLPRLLIPPDLVKAYASLFDDPDYSDVVFRIRPANKPHVRERKLYAIKKVLAGRCEYFETMFNSGFNESAQTTHSDPSGSITGSLTALDLDDDQRAAYDGHGIEDDGVVRWDDYDDDDDDEDDDEEDSDDEADSDADAYNEPETYGHGDEDAEEPQHRKEDGAGSRAFTVDESARARAKREMGGVQNLNAEEIQDEDGDLPHKHPRRDLATTNAADTSVIRSRESGDGIRTPSDATHSSRPSSPASKRLSQDEDGLSVAFVDAPASPTKPTRARDVAASSNNSQSTSRGNNGKGKSVGAGISASAKQKRDAGHAHKKVKDSRPRFEVVVTDATYQSYSALLGFLYTDSISFLPLSSNYFVAKEAAAAAGNSPFPWPSRKAFLLANTPAASGATTGSSLGSGGPASYMSGSSLLPASVSSNMDLAATATPASAKAIYRLADKLGLQELKDRAYDHIVKSLTVHNIPYEVFSRFTQQHDAIKRVQVAFLLERFADAKASPSFGHVLKSLRTGRFPGFESVFALLLEHLEYVPRPPERATDEDGSAASAARSGGGGSGGGGY